LTAQKKKKKKNRGSTDDFYMLALKHSAKGELYTEVKWVQVLVNTPTSLGVSMKTHKAKH
jgi:hypothetical protein